jgi:CheY-like chemotaxis protein
MDCLMPIMDGYQAAKEISKLYESGEINKMPLICALTGHCSPEH